MVHQFPAEVSGMQACFSTMSLPTLGEMEQTVCALERGTLIEKVYNKKRDTKTLMLRRETRQVKLHRDYCDRSSYTIVCSFIAYIVDLVDGDQCAATPQLRGNDRAARGEGGAAGQVVQGIRSSGRVEFGG